MILSSISYFSRPQFYPLIFHQHEPLHEPLHCLYLAERCTFNFGYIYTNTDKI